MKKSIPLLITAFILGSADMVSAHPTVATEGHHHILHQVAEKVAAGALTLDQATDEYLGNAEVRDGVKKDIQVHADQIRTQIKS